MVFSTGSLQTSVRSMTSSAAASPHTTVVGSTTSLAAVAACPSLAVSCSCSAPSALPPGTGVVAAVPLGAAPGDCSKGEATDAPVPALSALWAICSLVTVPSVVGGRTSGYSVAKTLVGEAPDDRRARARQRRVGAVSRGRCYAGKKVEKG